MARIGWKKLSLCVFSCPTREREKRVTVRELVCFVQLCVLLCGHAWGGGGTEREVMNAWFDQASHGWRGVRLKPAERREKGSWVLPQVQHKLLSSSSVCVSMDGCYGGAGG
ncbi:unnamed protein product [Camellia sinensis]